jgi:hypothetical protein
VPLERDLSRIGDHRNERIIVTDVGWQAVPECTAGRRLYQHLEDPGLSLFEIRRRGNGAGVRDVMHVALIETCELDLDGR